MFFIISSYIRIIFCMGVCVLSYLIQFLFSRVQYLLELTMINGDVFLNYLPSIMAAAAIFLANYTLGKEAWVGLNCWSQLEHIADNSVPTDGATNFLLCCEQSSELTR